jgi:hypothetical protein
MVFNLGYLLLFGYVINERVPKWLLCILVEAYRWWRVDSNPFEHFLLCWFKVVIGCKLVYLLYISQFTLFLVNNEHFSVVSDLVWNWLICVVLWILKMKLSVTNWHDSRWGSDLAIWSIEVLIINQLIINLLIIKITDVRLKALVCSWLHTSLDFINDVINNPYCQQFGLLTVIELMDVVLEVFKHSDRVHDYTGVIQIKLII